MTRASPTCSIRCFRLIKTPAMCWHGSRKIRFRSALPDRHARACPGHPRLSIAVTAKHVDGRDKPGHDEVNSLSPHAADDVSPQIRAHPCEHVAEHFRGQHPRIGIVTRAMIAVVKP